MNYKVTNTILEFTQNLGSKEDAATGILATMFSYCPKFTEYFFSEIGLGKKIDIFQNGSKGYFVQTGETIRNYKFLKGVSFKPDITLESSDDDDSWDTKDGPTGRRYIFIEVKLWAPFSSNQKKNYDSTRELLRKKNNTVDTIFIGPNPKKHELADGWKFLTWERVIKIIDEASTHLEDFDSEIVLLDDLLSLLKVHLCPEMNHFLEKNIILPKWILYGIVWRCDIKHKRISECEYDEEDHVRFFDKLKIPRNHETFYVEYEDNKFLACRKRDNRSAVVYFESTDSKNKILIVEEIGFIDFNDRHWQDAWFKLLNNIYNLIHI